MDPKYPCLSCDKSVRSNQNALMCVTCNRWIHLTCSTLDNNFFYSDSDFICAKCLLNILPFNNSFDEICYNSHPDIECTETASTNYECIGEKVKTISGISIAHLNVCSLVKNIDEIRLMLNKAKIDIITFCETRLDSTISDNEIYVDGYNVVRNDRNRNGGGVIIYVNSRLNYKVLEEFHNYNLELACIEVDLNKQKPFLLLSLYRPPDSGIGVFDDIENVLQSVETRFCDYILIGDMNCDLLHKTPSNYTKRLRSIADEYCLTQCVTKATRITKRSKTLIDHVFTSTAENVSDCTVIPISLSDHEMVMFSWKRNKPKSSGNHCYISSRNMKKINIESFVNDLKNVSLDETLEEKSTEKAYLLWVNKMRLLLDRHARVKKKRVRHRKSPWITVDVLNLIRERDKAKQTAKRLNTDSEWLKYKKLRNQVTSSVRKAKRKYITDSIKENVGNSSRMWKVLKELIPSSKVNTSIQKIVYEGTEYTGHKNIANALNNHFSTLAIKQRQNIEFKDNALQFVPRISTVFDFKMVTSEEVEKCIDKTPRNKATGSDTIPACILKDTLPYIIKSFTHLINRSLHEGVVPCEWKHAKITPLFKGGDAANPANYRPISVLPVASKILEKLVFKQAYSYLNGYNLLVNNQYGFRPNFSTDMALLNLTQDVNRAIDAGKVVIVVTLDLLKAFDMVPFIILIEKMKAYGFSDHAISWFVNYFHQRKQSTVINGNESEDSEVLCGVPQGSILGPLLFILYMNDLPCVIKNCLVSLYADDTCLYFASDNPEELEKNINDDLNAICEWLSHNKLMLNVKKCKFMLIGSKRKRQKFENITIKINNSPIEKVNHCRYLGIEIDSDLSWMPQVNNVRAKVLRNFHVLRRARSYIDQNTALTLYNTMIRPHFEYCSTIWMKPNSGHIKRLQTLQNRALRIVLKVDYRYHRRDLYHTLQVDCLNAKVKKELVTLIFKILKNLFPDILHSQINLKMTSYNLRNSALKIQLPKPRTNFCKNSTIYIAAKLFNELPESVRTRTTLSQFQRDISSIFILEL